jgi:hypothetical protein
MRQSHAPVFRLEAVQCLLQRVVATQQFHTPLLQTTVPARQTNTHDHRVNTYSRQAPVYWSGRHIIHMVSMYNAYHISAHATHLLPMVATVLRSTTYNTPTTRPA